MIKALFVVGQCIRLLNTDPWQAPTYKIETVGKFSMAADEYRYNLYTQKLEEAYKVVIPKGDYGVVPCPK